MDVGVSILLAVSIIIFLGFGHRALDRLRLTDKAALVVLVGILVGGYLPDLFLVRELGINIGGGLIPLGLVIYLLINAKPHERFRSLIASFLTAFIIFGAMKILPLEPTYNMLIDPLYFIAITAGVIGYLFGRSRRGAFIAAVLGVMLNDLAAFAENIAAGTPAPIIIGGAGAFDAIVIAGILSLGLAEVFGETMEKITLMNKKQDDQKEDNHPAGDDNNED